MSGTLTGVAAVLAACAVLCASGSDPLAQGLPKPTPDAKACAYLPIAELEAHFGTKAQNVAGLDQSTRHTCTARFPDQFHVAAIESHPPSPADQAMTAAQRLALVKDAVKATDTRDFGSIGCFRTTMKLARQVHDTSCFVAGAPYLSLALQSEDPAQVSYEKVKELLEKAAARRK